MSHVNHKIHAINTEMLIPWACKSCEREFPKSVKATEVTFGTPPTHLFLLCSVCARQLGRDLHRVGSQVDKRRVKELKEDYHG